MIYTFEHRGTMKPPTLDVTLKAIAVVSRFIVTAPEPLTDKVVAQLEKELKAILVSTSN